MSTTYDVVVVGYGPSGEVTASTLGIAGHRVAVFERQLTAYPLPRMVTFDGEACRTVQATGSDVDQALASSVALPSCSFGDAHADPLLVLDWSGEQCGFPAHNSIFQPDVEATLQERVDAIENVDVFRGTEVRRLVEHADRVELLVAPKGSADPAQERTVTAAYVVGCDGTGSFVRDAVGLPMRDYGMHERWLNFDMNKLTELPARFDKLIMIMDPARPHMYMPLGRTRQRFEMRLDDAEDEDSMVEPEVAWAFLGERYGLDRTQLSICRQVVYHYYTRVAQTWRTPRVLIAGDAAHTMTPYLGQGGCSAIRDGRNIGWKLDLVLAGVAAPDLLDTYQAEREAHVSTLVFTSHELAEVVNIIDEEAAARRNHAMRNHLAPPPPPFPKLEHGVLHHEADGSIAPVTGSLAPQGRLRRDAVEGRDGVEGRGDDVIGHGFQLISRGAPVLTGPDHVLLERIRCSVAVLDEPGHPDAVADLDGVYRAFLDEHGADAYVMRPDWYVFGVATRDGLPALLAELGSLLRLTPQPALVQA